MNTIIMLACVLGQSVAPDFARVSPSAADEHRRATIDEADAVTASAANLEAVRALALGLVRERYGAHVQFVEIDGTNGAQRNVPSPINPARLRLEPIVTVRADPAGQDYMILPFRDTRGGCVRLIIRGWIVGDTVELAEWVTFDKCNPKPYPEIAPDAALRVVRGRGVNVAPTEQAVAVWHYLPAVADAPEWFLWRVKDRAGAAHYVDQDGTYYASLEALP